jgi:hypothetical protein
MKMKALTVPAVLMVLVTCGAPSRPTSSNGGTSGTGGTSEGGNGAGSGGGTPSGTGGSSVGSGGITPSGGSTGQGGSVASGGVNNAGGNATLGGGSGSGGKAGAGGATASGGTTGAGGVNVSGGASGAGGTTGSGGKTGPQGPCDIYQAGNTPCAAAHSTVRALYSSYSGSLYQVQRASDKTTKDIPVGSAGYADTSVQDSFCAGTTCTIPVIYDQSPNGNHLRVTWWAYWLQSGGNPANATAAKITIAGHTAYGIKNTAFSTNVAYRTGVQLSGTASITKGSATVTFSNPQTIPANSPLMFTVQAKDCVPDSWPNNCNAHPYFTAEATSASTTVTLKTAYAGTASSSTVAWNQGTKGLASGDDPEAMYSVFDAKAYSQYCCFDYGNAEFDGVDDGDATMEALYFGASTQFGSHGSGSGPWFLADLENGMFAGDSKSESTAVASNTSITGMSFVTGMLKGPSGNKMVIKGGDAQSGKLQTKWDGARPPGYSPMKKQGAVILATGGDGSNGGTGIWFEGAITSGLPTDATDDAVQANIVAAGYGE